MDVMRHTWGFLKAISAQQVGGRTAHPAALGMAARETLRAKHREEGPKNTRLARILEALESGRELNPKYDQSYSALNRRRGRLAEALKPQTEEDYQRDFEEAVTDQRPQSSRRGLNEATKMRFLSQQTPEPGTEIKQPFPPLQATEPLEDLSMNLNPEQGRPLPQFDEPWDAGATERERS